MDSVFDEIKHDCLIRAKEFEEAGKLIEAQRIKERVFYDIEMMREVGYCNGIENYSRYFDGRKPGQAPYTLLDYFPEDFIVFVDNSSLKLAYKIINDEYVIDISSFNLIKATKIAIMCSTYCFIKDFKKKLCWLVEDEETRRAISILRLQNTHQLVKPQEERRKSLVS